MGQNNSDDFDDDLNNDIELKDSDNPLLKRPNRPQMPYMAKAAKGRDPYTDPDAPLPTNNRFRNPIPSQAARVVAKFGGVNRLVYLFNQHGEPIQKPAVYKWTYPVHRGGTGGYIPYYYWEIIFKIARFEGIVFSSEELDPRPFPYFNMKSPYGMLD